MLLFEHYLYVGSLHAASIWFFASWSIVSLLLLFVFTDGQQFEAEVGTIAYFGFSLVKVFDSTEMLSCLEHI